MDKTTSDKILQDLAQTVSTIREAAFRLHDSVGQIYGPDLPYGHHLEMVASLVRDHVQEVAACEEDVLPILFAAYYHDSIEDARLTYNEDGPPVYDRQSGHHGSRDSLCPDQ